jgi:hypothetical protein
MMAGSTGPVTIALSYGKDAKDLVAGLQLLWRSVWHGHGSLHTVGDGAKLNKKMTDE